MVVAEALQRRKGGHGREDAASDSASASASASAALSLSLTVFVSAQVFKFQISAAKRFHTSGKCPKPKMVPINPHKKKMLTICSNL